MISKLQKIIKIADELSSKYLNTNEAKIIQPCHECGIETLSDAYIRYVDDNITDDKVKTLLLCLQCALEFDKRTLSREEFLDRWVYDESVPE